MVANPQRPSDPTRWLGYRDDYPGACGREFTYSLFCGIYRLSYWYYLNNTQLPTTIKARRAKPAPHDRANRPSPREGQRRAAPSRPNAAPPPRPSRPASRPASHDRPNGRNGRRSPCCCLARRCLGHQQPNRLPPRGAGHDRPGDH